MYYFCYNWSSWYRSNIIFLGREYLNGEGESLSEDFPAGEYEVVIEVTDEDVTGTVEINVEK